MARRAIDRMLIARGAFVAWVALVACHLAGAAVPPPPGVAPSRVAPLERPPIGFDAAIRSVVDAARAGRGAPGPVAEVEPSPAPAGVAEEVALRRFVRGRLRVLEGQVRRGSEELDAALRLDPGSATLHAARAEAAQLDGDFASALAEWERVLELQPGNAQALVSLGMASFEVGRHARAAELLGRAWPLLAQDGFASVSDAGRFAIGSALARSLYRLGFLEAGVQVALPALEVPPALVAAQRGDGLDAAERAAGQLALETGEAVLRCRRPDAAFALLARSQELLPDTATVALAAYAQLLAGDQRGARGTLGVLLSADPWLDASDAVRAQWLLEVLGGDPSAREQLAVAAIAAGGRLARGDGQPPDVRARLALLQSAAGDPSSGAAMLVEAIRDGATDPRGLEAAFVAAGDAESPALAAEVVARSPGSLRETCRALVRACRDQPALRRAVRALAAGEVRDCLEAGVLATLRASGEAWSRAADAVDADPSRLALEAMLLAAVAADDPALVARAAGSAPVALDADAGWHASLALAFADTGASFEAEQSLARAMLRLDAAGSASPGDAHPAKGVIAQARAAVDGRAAGAGRTRADAAAADADPSRATGELLLAHESDPGDDQAFESLVRALRLTEGVRGAAAWVAAELERHPNDHRLWRAAAALAPEAGTVDALLAVIDRRVAADPSDTVVLEAHETLLRTVGRQDAALAAARARIASMPPGARRPLAEAELALAADDPAAATEALARFAESAFAPPAAMRMRALEVARRVRAGTPGRAAVIRDIARDAILTDPRSSLDFYAFEALGAASVDAGTPEARAVEVARIAAEAAAVPELRDDGERWRACADLLLSQGQPRAAAEFVRARLDDPTGLGDEAIRTLARAAVACDATAGGRAAESLALASHLASLGHAAFGAPGRPSSSYLAVSSIHTLVGDRAGAESIMEAGLAVDPADAQLLNNLGYARLERGAVDARTEALLEGAVRASPSDPNALDSLGWLRYLQGRVDGTDAEPGARSLLERAVAAPGGAANGVRQLHVGDARWRAGDHAGARRAWAECRRLCETGLPRERNLELLREAFRRQVGLASVDVSRYHDENDGSVAAAAAARLAALEAGSEPPVTPVAPAAGR